MTELELTLPIYHTFTFKTKKDKKVLIGLNWYRNVHYITNNNVKKEFHKLVNEQYDGQKFNKAHIHYKVYVRTRNTDGHNIRSIIEKYVLDGLVHLEAIVDDSLDYVVSSSSEFHLDKDNPRIEVTVEEKT